MIETIRVANLGPFRGVQEVSLGEGIISIEGRYVGKRGKSNRAGKSFFAVDLLRFLLYGRHRYSRVNKIIHRLAKPKTDPCYGAITLSLPGDDHITAIRNYDTFVSRFVLDLPTFGESTEKMKQGELQSLLDSTLGCTGDDAVLTWLVMQGRANGIMDLQISQRKTFLLSLFSTVQYPWEAYYAEAADRVKQVTGRQMELSSQYSRMADALHLQNKEALAIQLAEEQRLKKEIEKQRDEMVAERARIQEQIKKDDIGNLQNIVDMLDSKVQSTHSTLTITRRQLITFTRNVERLELAKTELAAAEEAYEEVSEGFDASKLPALKAGYTTAVKANHKMLGEFSALTDRISNIDQFQGHGKACPVTGEACPQGADIATYRVTLVSQADRIQGDLKESTQKEQTLQEAIAVIEAQLADMQTLEKQILGLREVIKDLKSAPVDLKMLQRAGVEQEQAYLELRKEKQEAEQHLQQAKQRGELQYQRMLQDLDNVYRTLTNQIAIHDGNIAKLNGEIQYIKRVEADIKVIQSEMRRQEDRVQVLKALRPALSKDGIPFLGLVASINEFEAEINRAMMNLGTDIRVEISPYRQLSTWEPLCGACGYEFTSSIKKCPVCQELRTRKREETLEIQLRGSAFNVDFQEDSGGGKLLVSLAIRLALFSVLRERGHMQGVDFWVMDEVFSPLDMSAKASMLQFMDDLRDMYGFRQLFIISHTDLSDVIPPSIIIERNDEAQESIIVA